MREALCKCQLPCFASATLPAAASVRGNCGLMERQWPGKTMGPESDGAEYSEWFLLL